jgi:hypothetical protein
MQLNVIALLANYLSADLIVIYLMWLAQDFTFCTVKLKQFVLSIVYTGALEAQHTAVAASSLKTPSAMPLQQSPSYSKLGRTSLKSQFLTYPGASNL